MDKLVQTKFFLERIYELTETGINIKEKRNFNTVEIFLSYEEVGVRVLKHEKAQKSWSIAAIVSFAFAVIFKSRNSDFSIDLLIVGVICWLVYLFTKSKLISLTQENQQNAIEFLADNPTKEDFKNFIDALKSKRKNVLDEKYGHINTMLSYEENYHNLMGLFNNEVIEKSEFDKRMNELNSKFNKQPPSEKKIGFNLNDN